MFAHPPACAFQRFSAVVLIAVMYESQSYFSMASQDAVTDAAGANGVLGTNGINGIYDIHNEADTNDSNHVKDMHLSDILELDVILIGAGFSAFTLLNRYAIASVTSKD
jgi:hypothetical protein